MVGAILLLRCTVIARILSRVQGVQIWNAQLCKNSVHILGATTLAVAGYLDSRRKGRNHKRPPRTQTRRPPGLDVHEGGLPPSQVLSATQAPSMRAWTRRREKQPHEARKG